jgi:hypothetical protein
MTPFRSLALAAALAGGLTMTSGALAQSPSTNPADPRSPGAVVPPGGMDRDVNDTRKRESDRTKRDGSSYGRDSPVGTGAPTSSNNPTTPRPPASDGSGKNY